MRVCLSTNAIKCQNKLSFVVSVALGALPTTYENQINALIKLGAVGGVDKSSCEYLRVQIWTI